MAAASDDKTGTGNAAVASTHDHDRVALLSVRADGTPDQVAPEFIGDHDATLAATEEQFVQQAVSAADDEARRVLRKAQADGYAVSTKQDPSIAKLEEATEKAAKAGKAAAAKAVKGNDGADK